VILSGADGAQLLLKFVGAHNLGHSYTSISTIGLRG